MVTENQANARNNAKCLFFKGIDFGGVYGIYGFSLTKLKKKKSKMGPSTELLKTLSNSLEGRISEDLIFNPSR